MMRNMPILIAIILATGCASSRLLQREIDKLPWRGQPAAEQPEPVAEYAFVWEPEGDLVRVRVRVPHWQWSLTVTSPAVHHTMGLIGNTRGSANEYVLQGDGNYWRERSLAIDPAGGGAVVFFVNLNGPDPATGWTAKHWVVPDPRVRTEVTK